MPSPLLLPLLPLLLLLLLLLPASPYNPSLPRRSALTSLATSPLLLLSPSPALAGSRDPPPDCAAREVGAVFTTVKDRLKPLVSANDKPAVQLLSRDLDSTFRKRYLSSLLKTLNELDRPRGRYLTNAVGWDLIALSKWARGEGGVEEGEEILRVMQGEVEEYVGLGEKVVEEAA